MVTCDAGLISVLLLCMWRNQNCQDRFFLRIANLVTHRKRNIQTLSGVINVSSVACFRWHIIVSYMGMLFLQ